MKQSSVLPLRGHRYCLSCRSEGFPRTRITKRSCACDCGRGPVSVGACILSFSLSLSLFLSLSLSLCLYAAQGVGVLRSRLLASLFRALVDGPGLQPTDMRNHTSCVSRALVPTFAVDPPHVGHRQRPGQSPKARTCSKTWTCLERLHI